jgi:hypothetical protein
VPRRLPHGLAELAEVKRIAGQGRRPLQGIFVTVDPERDTPEVLKGYMANFDPSFLALRGTPEQLAAVAKDYKVYYKKVDGKTPTSYTMDHSAGSFVYDTQGRMRLYTRYGSRAGGSSGWQVLARGAATHTSGGAWGLVYCALMPRMAITPPRLRPGSGIQAPAGCG